VPLNLPVEARPPRLPRDEVAQPVEVALPVDEVPRRR